LSQVKNNKKAKILADTLDKATGKLMDNRKAPGRELGQLDNAGSHVYEALYWAQELAAQNDDQDLKKQFAPIAKELESKVESILEEIKAAKGRAQDIGGYYRPDPVKVKTAMRPSATLNAILDRLA
jgi:isocitrate dehydrogenase